MKTPKPGTPSKGYRPDMLGDYELLAEIMRDKFGSLAAARNIGGKFDEIDILVVRSIQPSAWIDAWLVEDLCQAAWGIKGQKLDRVAPVHDVILADGRVGIVQDYAEGETLRTLLRAASSRRNKVAPAVVARLGLDVLEAMTSVQGLLERKPELATLVTGGLAPDRVLMETSGEAWLFELPLSGRAAVKAVLGQDDDMLGYRAPEHYAPGGESDARSDQFVLAAMMWELIAGKPLFAVIGTPGAAAKGLEAPAVQAVMKAVLPKLDGVDAKLQDVLRRALDADPAKRYASAAEMAKALSAAVKPAEHAEVGKLVELLAGQTMSSRKAAINRALRLSDPGGSARVPEAPISSRSPRPGPVAETPKDKADAKPQDKADAKPQDKAETKPQDKAETKPQDKAETKPQDKAEARPEEKVEAKTQDKAETKPQEGGVVRPLREGKPKGVIPERKRTLLGMPATIIEPKIVEKPDPELDDIPMDDAFAESFEEGAKQFPAAAVAAESKLEPKAEEPKAEEPAPGPVHAVDAAVRAAMSDEPATVKASPAAIRSSRPPAEPKAVAAWDDDEFAPKPKGRVKMIVLGAVGAVALIAIGVVIGRAGSGDGPGASSGPASATAAPGATTVPAATASAASLPAATEAASAVPSATAAAPTAAPESTAEAKPAATSTSEAKAATPPETTAKTSTTRPNTTTSGGSKTSTKSTKSKPSKGFTPSSI